MKSCDLAEITPPAWTAFVESFVKRWTMPGSYLRNPCCRRSQFGKLPSLCLLPLNFCRVCKHQRSLKVLELRGCGLRDEGLGPSRGRGGGGGALGPLGGGEPSTCDEAWHTEAIRSVRVMGCHGLRLEPLCDVKTRHD